MTFNELIQSEKPVLVDFFADLLFDEVRVVVLWFSQLHGCKVKVAALFSEKQTSLLYWYADAGLGC